MSHYSCLSMANLAVAGRPSQRNSAGAVNVQYPVLYCLRSRLNLEKFQQQHPNAKIDPVRLKGTGHNRQSLDVEFEETPSGTQAKLFSQSGYGGYLELGTSKMRAQPYIWPAFLKFYNKIVGRVQVK